MSARDSLAARLGMRRSPSGPGAAGALTQPPQEPEWELLAEEITGARARMHRAAIAPGPAPDPLVFGPQYECTGIQLPVVHCRACEAGWSVYGGARCWCCGKEGR